MKTYRILVTGWRDWPEVDKHVVWDALNAFQSSCEIPAQFIVVHGQCPYGGVDLYAEEWAISKGHTPEAHPAPWTKFGKAAGMIRNAEMVNLGADVCFGFPGPSSRGTVDCMKKARAAGIETKEIAWSGHVIQGVDEGS